MQTRVATLSKQLQDASNKTVNYFENKLQTDGSIKKAGDIACYFRLPMLFQAANKAESANTILNYIEANFLQEDGDFKTNITLKSEKDEYNEYYAYVNGWIIRAVADDANPIIKKGFPYLKQHYVDKDAGCYTHELLQQKKTTDILTSAHVGLIALEKNYKPLAASIGNYLCDAVNNQVKIHNGFYLRFDENKNPITKFNAQQTPFYFINRNESNQCYFMLAYSAAFLAILWKKTKEQKYLDAAIAYLDFALSCKDVYQTDRSHQLAWALSLLFEITSDEKYFVALELIAQHFLNKQTPEGLWSIDKDITTTYDQSAEIAYCMLEANKNLLSYTKKLNSDNPENNFKTESTWRKTLVKCTAISAATGFAIFGLYALTRSTDAETIKDATAEVVKKMGME